MLLFTDDLTRTGGGDAIAARLPSTVSDRSAAAESLVDRAIVRWALDSVADQLRAAVVMTLIDQVAVAPIDMCIRLSSQLVELQIGTHLVPVPLPATDAVSAGFAA